MVFVPKIPSWNKQANKQTNKRMMEDSENVVTKAAKYIDSHIRMFQYGIYTLGAVGLGIVFRSIKISSKFRSARDIPPEFISKHFRLLGTVKRVHQEKLIVDHIPIFCLGRRNGSGNLHVNMAGVILTSDGINWLKQHIEGNRIWFKLIGKENDTVSCIVSTVQIWPKAPLNISLVKHGLGTVTLPDSRYVNNHIYQHLYKKLIKAEMWADEHERGLWQKESRWQKFKQTFELVQHKIKNFLFKSKIK